MIGFVVGVIPEVGLRNSTYPRLDGFPGEMKKVANNKSTPGRGRTKAKETRRARKEQRTRQLVPGYISVRLDSTWAHVRSAIFPPLRG